MFWDITGILKFWEHFAKDIREANKYSAVTVCLQKYAEKWGLTFNFMLHELKCIP
jgi:hypothetical protein